MQPKFYVGQRVELAFNPPTPDPRVPDQVNGRFPGRGEYQTEPVNGEVLEVHDAGESVSYLVLVELKRTEVRGKRPETIISKRRRLVPEAGIRAALN